MDVSEAPSPFNEYTTDTLPDPKKGHLEGGDPFFFILKFSFGHTRPLWFVRARVIKRRGGGSLTGEGGGTQGSIPSQQIACHDPFVKSNKFQLFFTVNSQPVR